jgi:general secretion pathway protein A
MYEDYWQLATAPFAYATSDDAYFPSEAHDGALLKFRYAIDAERGAAAMIGPSGVGKSLLVRRLTAELSADERPVIEILFPQMSSRELLAYLAAKLSDGGEISSADQAVRRIETSLAEFARKNQRPIVVIDDAQVLEEAGALDTLRLLLNFTADPLSQGRGPALTLLLVGQLPLLSAIARMPALEDRIAVKTLLRSFTLDESAAYIEHRLRAAGAEREIFTPGALEKAHFLAEGSPRKLNRLCDLALLVGFANQQAQVEAGDLENVNRELVTVAAATGH